MNCDPVSAGEEKLDHLLYGDDVFLVSKAAEVYAGLLACLDPILLVGI